MADFPDDTLVSINCFEISNLASTNITMDQTIPIISGINAKLSGKIPPIGGPMGGGQGIGGSGKTMKEFEDHLGILKKENFNLKLRIYFLEERMGITSADEDAIKKNIELKVENESLRKELIEKQELLSQAAKAIELIEEQKHIYAKNQAQYQHTLKLERERVDVLEKELEEYKERLTDAAYFEKTFGITPEKALEYKEKLHQMEEIKSSLEFELKQQSASLEEERNWIQELENEKDQLKNRLESEILSKEQLSLKRDQEMEILNDKIKKLEEQTYKTENILQQLKKEIIDKDKIIAEKSSLFEEKCKAFEEVTEVVDKRKKQVDHLRLSVKSRDDALTDLNNRNRSLLIQFENNYVKKSSSPRSPSTFIEESQKIRNTCDLCSPTKTFNGSIDLESSIEQSRDICNFHLGLDKRDIQDLKKELDNKDREIKNKEEKKKQLMLKLYNVQQSANIADQKFKKLEIDHKKAIQMIQGFVKRHEQLENKQAKKDRRIMDLEVEISKLRSENTKVTRSSISATVRRNLSNEFVDGPERDLNTQQQIEEMESKINDLRDQVEATKAEKNLLEKRIQIETEELQDRLQNKNLKFQYLKYEKKCIEIELQYKNEELDNLKESYNEINIKSEDSVDLNNLRKELVDKNLKLEEKSQQLLIRTQNLQKLINTELWNKNKEIAKLHNHMTTSEYQEKNRIRSNFTEESAASQLNTLIKELNEIGMQVTFTNDIIQLNYLNSDRTVDITMITNYIHKLIAQKSKLEKEVDYLKWLKFVSKSVNKIENEICDFKNDSNKHYYELLRIHLNKLIQLINEILKNADQKTDITNNKQKKIVFDILMNSKMLSVDFMNALEAMKFDEGVTFNKCYNIDKPIRKSKSDNFIDYKFQFSIQSDLEIFSESDIMVSFPRMRLLDKKQKYVGRFKFSNFIKTFSDSEDSVDYCPCYKIEKSDVNDFEANRQIFYLKEVNSFLYSELNTLKNDLIKNEFNDVINTKLSMLFSKLNKLQTYCEKLQNILENKIHECNILKKENNQNNICKLQMEKKIFKMKNVTLEFENQKAELLQCKNNNDKKVTEMLKSLNKENEMLRIKIKNLEEGNEETKAIILKLTKELDYLTLSHSRILVKNTKLINDKLRLQHEIRKSENCRDLINRKLQDKFYKEVIDLNKINESNQVRMQELEVTNKERKRHAIVYETSDSTCSTGISLIPLYVSKKQICDDIVHEYNTYNGFQYWLPTLNIQSKSSCSPDLGIESDATVTSMRPLKDTLRITESMSNLFSDDNNYYNYQGHGNTDDNNLLPMEDLDVINILKEENVALKRRLMKTRRALEDTFQHLSASNKNKKNFEKSIAKQLMITKSILKKTRSYEDTHNEN